MNKGGLTFKEDLSGDGPRVDGCSRAFRVS